MTATLGEILRAHVARLDAAGVDSARLDARLLAAHGLGVSQEIVLGYPERVLSAGETERVAALVAMRAERRPMAQILGTREFWSLPFRVTADTLDPRPDSETVIEAALEAFPDRHQPYRILDFGTGTGCLLLALLSELPSATGLGIDCSAAALAVAKDNAGALGLAHRALFRQGDWGLGLDGAFDIILANPPYIPEEEIALLEPEVASYEPHLALSGGPDGLACYRALAPHILRLLAEDGKAVLEFGQGQAASVASVLAEAGLAVAAPRHDLSGIERCILANRIALSGKG